MDLDQGPRDVRLFLCPVQKVAFSSSAHHVAPNSARLHNDLHFCNHIHNTFVTMVQSTNSPLLSGKTRLADVPQNCPLAGCEPTGPLTSLLPATTPRTRPSDDQVFAHKPQQTTLLRSPYPRVTVWEPRKECQASPMHQRSEERDACASALDLLRAKKRVQRVEKGQVQGTSNSKAKEGELRGKSS